MKENYILKGIGASPGIVEGPAKIIENLNDRYRLDDGDILVARDITSDWMDVYFKIIGVVVEEGGITTHAAIAARELEIPCVVCAEGVVENTRDGERIKIDGSKGEIYYVDRR